MLTISFYRFVESVGQLGPTTENIIEQLIVNGMDTARINQSHETYEIHTRRINELKRARERLNKPVALLMDRDINYKDRFYKEEWFWVKNIVNIIGQATTVAAFELDVKAIVVITNSGNSARMISRFRPSCPIIAITVEPEVERQLNMSWGIYPVRTEYIAEADKLFSNSIKCAKKTGIVKDKDLVVLTSGLPTSTTGKTNMLKIHRIGEDVL